MLKYLKFLILFILLQATSLGDIQPITSIKSKFFQDLIQKADPNTLIVINIDNTLITPQAKMFSYQNSPYINFINDLLKQAQAKPYLYKAIGTWYAQRKIKLVEDGWPELLDKLKDSKAKIFGLASINSNIYEILKDPEDKQYQELHTLNIDFTNRILDKQLIDLKSVSGRHGLFYKGIIFTGPFSRSKILSEFLRITTLMPKRIIYIDSNINNIKQLEYSFRTFDLIFNGINYLAAEQFKDAPNKEIVKLQQKSLIVDNKWLEDDEAETLLKRKLKN